MDVSMHMPDNTKTINLIWRNEGNIDYGKKIIPS